MKIHNISIGITKIILSIDKTYISIISRNTGITYAYTTKVINDLSERNILIKKKKGRITIIELTNKGKELKSKLIEIQNLYE